MAKLKAKKKKGKKRKKKKKNKHIEKIKLIIRKFTSLAFYKRLARKIYIWILSKTWWKYQWFYRRKKLPERGLDWRQTEDCLGVVLSDGRYVSYGKEWHDLYFKGYIKDKNPAYYNRNIIMIDKEE